MFNSISQQSASQVKIAGLGRNLALAGGGLATLGALAYGIPKAQKNIAAFEKGYQELNSLSGAHELLSKHPILGGWKYITDGHKDYPGLNSADGYMYSPINQGDLKLNVKRNENYKNIANKIEQQIANHIDNLPVNQDMYSVYSDTKSDINRLHEHLNEQTNKANKNYYYREAVNNPQYQYLDQGVRNALAQLFHNQPMKPQFTNINANGYNIR